MTIHLGPGEADYEEPDAEPVPYVPLGRSCKAVEPNADMQRSYILPIEWFRRHALYGSPREAKESGFTIGQEVKLILPECGGITVRLTAVDIYMDIADVDGAEGTMIVGPGLVYLMGDGQEAFIPADWAKPVTHGGQSPYESKEFRDFMGSLRK